MSKEAREKRAFPRVKVHSAVDISGHTIAEAIDVSELGVCFSAQEQVASPVITLQIRFPDRETELKAKAKLVWSRDVEGGVSLYGVEFVGLNKNKKAALREELINTQISNLLKDIRNEEVRGHVSHFFHEDILNYIREVSQIIPKLTKQKDYSLPLEKEIEHLTNKVLLKAYCLELMLVDKSVLQKIKDNFRHLIGTWIYKSAIVKHAFDKPRGHSEDYKMLETIYNNKPISKNIGVYFDAVFLKSPYAVGLRIRKKYIQAMLKDIITESKESHLKIMSIGCGPSREIRELFPELHRKIHVTFSCVDADEEALGFSKDTLLIDAPKNTAFSFVREDVTNIIKGKSLLESEEKQDVIYSMGMMDYLPDRAFKKLITTLCELLNEGGKLIITHKNKEKTIPPIGPDWFCGWTTVGRDKEQVVELIRDSGVPVSALSIESDDFGYIHYFSVIKQ